MFSCRRSPALSAVMLIAVACTVDSRFSAVTTISSNPVSPGAVPAGAADADPLKVAAHRSAEIIDARNATNPSAAHNTCFMYESP
jgi:hypothetical protein